MCIRDRVQGDEITIHFPNETQKTFSVRSTPIMDDSGRIVAAVATMAVSYTHLRAHETVLDLVCRLLLEKTTTMIRRSPLLSQAHSHDYLLSVW